MRYIFHSLLRTGLSLGIMLTLILYASGFYPLALISQLELFAYDARLRLTLPGGVDPRIVIVDIDEVSLLREGQWPWPRQRLAQLVETLFADYHIQLLAFDIVFAETERDTASSVLETLARGALREDTAFQREWAALRPAMSGDAHFAASLRDRPVVLGYYFAMPDQQGQNLRVGQLPAAAAPLTALAGAPSPLPWPPGTAPTCHCCRPAPGAADSSTVHRWIRMAGFAGCRCCCSMAISFMSISVWRRCARCWVGRRWSL